MKEVGILTDTMKTTYRTHMCGSISPKHLHKKVLLVGWVRLLRDHGGVRFVELHDRSGGVQVVFDPQITQNYEEVEKLGREYIIQVEGTVRKRPAGMEDPSLPTGTVEVVAHSFKIISKSKVPPFELVEEKKAFIPSEELRLKYRYLDLRRTEMIEKLKLVHQIARIAREYFWKKGFWEIGTPYLVRHTPEGARDFVVPVRALPGKFYSLPQSPQIYKQLLMISGVDRYFQLAKCFRDEDLREDRQPEFTQIDIEMSFVTREEIIRTIEKFIKRLFYEIKGVKKVKFTYMEYDEALKRYGSDKCDLRYPIEIRDVSELITESNYRILKRAVEKGMKVKCMRIPQLYKKGFTQRDAQKLIKYVQEKLKGSGLTWLIVDKSCVRSVPQTIAECFPKEVQRKLLDCLGCEEGDIIFMVADYEPKVFHIMGRIRKEVIQKFDLEKKERFSFVWILNPPYFEIDEYGKATAKPAHHPFTAPAIESVEYLQQPRELIKACAFDLVINGVEVGSGSMRIKDPELQMEVFRKMGYSDEEIRKSFGFFIDALKYGAPPHGGMALGLERLAMVIDEYHTIRDFIPFPKTKNFRSPVDDAPTTLSQEKLRELGIITIGGAE